MPVIFQVYQATGQTPARKSDKKQSAFRTNADSSGAWTELPWREMDNRQEKTISMLFDQYHGTVYAIAMSLLMNRCDAEEVSREVFLEVMRDSDRFRREPALSSRICRICVNACLARLRKEPRTKTVPIEEFLPVFTEEGAHAMPVADWSREAEGRLQEREVGRLIDGLTGELPERYRVVFALCDVHGFSCEETAQVLDLGIAEVKSDLHRSRLCLRERLGRCLQDRWAVSAPLPSSVGV